MIWCRGVEVTSSSQELSKFTTRKEKQKWLLVVDLQPKIKLAKGRALVLFFEGDDVVFKPVFNARFTVH